MNISDPHVDDKNTCGASMIGTIIHIIDHGTILETYPASPKTFWRFKICRSYHGSAWLLQSTRKNVCTQRLFWLRDMISISLMRKRVAPKPQLRLLSRPLSFRCATHSGTPRLTFWRRSGVLCLSTFTMRKLHSQRTLYLHNYFVHNIRPCMDADAIRRMAFI